MPTRLALVVAIALATAGQAAAETGQAASASLSSPAPGAHRVGLTLELNYMMQCGLPGPGPVRITFPSQMVLPAIFPRAAVLVDGRPAPSVTRTGREVDVGLPPPKHGIMCMSITTGTLTIRFTPAAGLGNPSGAGIYPLTIVKAALSFKTALSLRA